MGGIERKSSVTNFTREPVSKVIPTSHFTLGCLSHTAAACRWQLLHLVPAVRVVEEGHVFMVGGPAAGYVVPQLPWHRLREYPAQQQVGESEVVVRASVGTNPAAVFEEDSLIWVVAQPKVSDLQQDGAQATLRVQGGSTRANQGNRWRVISRSFCLALCYSWIYSCVVHICWCVRRSSFLCLIWRGPKNIFDFG